MRVPFFPVVRIVQHIVHTVSSRADLSPATPQKLNTSFASKNQFSTKMTTDDMLECDCPELRTAIKDWLRCDKNEKTHNEIQSLVESKKWADLEKRLLSRLSFGTAGLRGVMQAGFNAMNDLVIVQTAQGLCKYILESYSRPEDREKGIVIGYDGRHNSRRFAELTANVFLHHKIPVWLFSKTVATPMVPFAIVEKQLLAGVMVTASHNPKEDNGYKVYWANGAQIISPHDKHIQKAILESLEPLPSSWDVNTLKSPLLNDPYGELFPLYFTRLESTIPTELITQFNANSTIEFVYTAMHGVGYPFVEESFSMANLRPLVVVKEQCEPDPEFPTVKFPNPEEGKSCLVLSIKLAEERKCTIILANDPDADRLAVAEKDEKTGKWKVFTGNELGALLGWWSVVCFRMQNPGLDLKNCYLLASTVSSKILKSMGSIDGFNFIETLTGFKWMGNKSVELMAQGKKVLFAFEEAIGFMFSTAVLDKDGVSAACHLATMACYLKKNNQLTLNGKLNEIYDKYGFHCTNNSYLFCYDQAIIVKIFERLRNFDGADKYPSSIMDGKYEIESVRDLTTGRDTSQVDGKALLPASKSTQMITFTFKNGVVLTLRTSGTEPKIKYYAEMCAKPSEKDHQKLRDILQEMIDATVEEMLQPKLNNLTARSE